MGAKTRLIYNNLWRKGTIIDESSEAAQHPSTDTQIDTKSMSWRSTAVDVAQHVSNKIEVEEEAQEYNFVALLNHNIRATATIEVIGANTDAFSDGDADDVLPETSWSEDDIFFFLPTARTKKYVKIKVTDVGNPLGYIQIATILCGKYAELNRRFAPEYEIGEEDFSEFEYSDSQVLFAQEKETLNIRRYSYQALKPTSKDVILAMFKECKTIKAFAVCLDHTAPNTNTLWVRNSELNAPVCRNGVWYWDMAITEIM